MYTQNRVSQSRNIVVIAIICLLMGCSKGQPESIKLDSALKTHHSLIAEGKTGSARVRLRQYMDLHGETPDSLFLMGFSYHQEQKYGKAVDWFQKSVLSTGRSYPLALHFLGWSHLYLGDIEASKEAFDKFLFLSPDDPDSIFALGLLAMERGDVEKSRTLFLKVISLAPRDQVMRAKATARLADVFAEQDNWDGAVRAYKEALQLNPDLYEAWYRLSQALKRVNKEKESQAAFLECKEARARVHPEWETTRFPE